MTIRPALLVLVLLVPASAFAQVDRAALTGVVHDASGAVVPAALIKLTKTACRPSDLPGCPTRIEPAASSASTFKA